ncbi:S9 family peptidase [Pseudalkalibacillus caeni]|uniref:S9 family peptidase n=1 Tax=Exobacillus caeni TaxID=2574798 RepID=A0A5R9F699_9BACL|nr:S9 family peptidase [Pseudalkalibacillus caeni]TLS38541.1 S9 family peptidase [Pseudalkalibacillus caeni]
MTVTSEIWKQKNKIDSETLYDLKFVGDPQLSPCGQKVAYIKTTINDEKDYESHLFVYDRKTGESNQWTFGASRNQSPRWAATGEKLAFVSNRSGKNQIWIISAGGGEATQLTNLKNGASNPVWRPDNKALLFVSPLEEGETLETTEEHDKKAELQPLIVDKLQYKADGRGFLDNKKNQLILIDLKTKQMEQLTSGPYNHSDPTWSPDGSAVAYARDREDEPGSYFLSDLFIKPIGEEAYRVNDEEGVFSKPNWSPDGDALSYIGHLLEYDGATLNRVWVTALDSKETRCLTADVDLECTDVLISDMHWANPSPGAVWKKDGLGVYFQGSENGNTNIYYASLAGGVSKTVGGKRHVYAFNYLPLLDEAIIGISDPTNIGDLYSVSFKTSEEQRLTHSNQVFLQETETSSPEEFHYITNDGYEIQGWLMKPAGFDPAKRYPLVLEIHGGPHMMYGNSFVHEFQLLASKGFVVLYTNPRGSLGYGQQFVDACRGDYGGGDYEDLMAGVDFVLANYGIIDEEKLFVTGGSYGGFMTNWIVGKTNRFKAAVTQRSISNWQSFYGVSDIGYFFANWEIGSHLTDDPEKLWEHSPLKYVDQIETPLLILHGEKDYRCPVEQAEQLFIALKHQNKVTRFVRFPESDHNLSRTGAPTLRVERLNQIAGWFEDYLERGQQ